MIVTELDNLFTEMDNMTIDPEYMRIIICYS
jgi:hypothetical protein